jgi:hypothetical protein
MTQVVSPVVIVIVLVQVHVFLPLGLLSRWRKVEQLNNFHMQIMNNEILQMVWMKLNKQMLVPPHCTGKQDW